MRPDRIEIVLPSQDGGVRRLIVDAVVTPGDTYTFTLEDRSTLAIREGEYDMTAVREEIAGRATEFYRVLRQHVQVEFWRRLSA